MQLHMTSFPYLSLILLSCVAGIILILFIPENQKKLIKSISAVCSGLTMAVALFIFAAFDRNLSGFQFVEKISWVPSLGISYFNGVDGFGAPMVLLTSIVFFTGVLTMWELSDRVKEFFALFMLLVMGVFGMFMALDLFFIFVWFDVSLFPMYLLIILWGHTRREYASMKLTLYLLFGSALILPTLIYMVVHSSGHSFALTDLVRTAAYTPLQQKFAFLMFYIGFGILAGVWPFHTWSPIGYVAAPTAVSMVHAGVLKNLGAFGIIRLGIFLCPEGWHFWAPLMGFLAMVGIVYAALAALRQEDLKFVIGYSSVSHMGIVGLGLSCATVDGLNGAVFQMFAHGIMTALFFSSTGYIYDRTHTKQIPELGGLSAIMPVASGYFIFAALAGIGVPFLANFWAELIVFIAAFHVYPVYAIISLTSFIIGALFIMRMIQKTCFGEPRASLSHLPDVSLGLGLPRMILVICIVIFGFMPFLLYQTIQTTSYAVISGLP